MPSSPPQLVAPPATGAETDLAKYGRLVSGNNPNFMEQYYQQSRLHLLSTSGNEAKSFVRQLQEEHLARGEALPPFSSFTAPGRVIVHIDLDAFFVSVSLRERSELANKPVVIAHSKREGSSEISSCNYVARNCGVRNGMSMRRALAVCPDLQVGPSGPHALSTLIQSPSGSAGAPL
jgi:DNA repair protein REV1